MAQPQEHWLSNKHIVCIGAGPASLSFICAMSKLWPQHLPPPSLTVLERDSKADRAGSRQGYTLSIRTDPGSRGVQVLDRLGLYDAIHEQSVQSVKDSSDAGFCIWRSVPSLRHGNGWEDGWEEILKLRSQDEESKEGKGRVMGCRIRRNALQSVLVESVQNCGLLIDMRWETKVIGVRPQPSTRRETSLGTGQTDTAGATMQVQLASGETLRADIVIAADGARSTIRRHYNASASAGGLDYAGVAIVSGVSQFPSPEDVPQRIRACWGLVISGTGTGLFVSPVDNTSALWSLSYYTEERVEDRRWPMSNDVLEKLMAKAKELASSFDGTVNELVDKTNLATLMQLSAMDRPAFAHHVQRDGNVVWLGDANHAVSPFAGNGANLALNDGWDFAEALLTTSTGFEEAVKSYDKDAMPRAQQTRKMSRWVIDFAHATGWKLWVYLFLLRVMSWVFLRGNRKVQTQKERAD